MTMCARSGRVSRGHWLKALLLDEEGTPTESRSVSRISSLAVLSSRPPVIGGEAL